MSTYVDNYGNIVDESGNIIATSQDVQIAMSSWTPEQIQSAMNQYGIDPATVVQASGYADAANHGGGYQQAAYNALSGYDYQIATTPEQQAAVQAYLDALQRGDKVGQLSAEFALRSLGFDGSDISSLRIMNGYGKPGGDGMPPKAMPLNQFGDSVLDMDPTWFLQDEQYKETLEKELQKELEELASMAELLGYSDLDDVLDLEQDQQDQQDQQRGRWPYFWRRRRGTSSQSALNGFYNLMNRTMAMQQRQWQDMLNAVMQSIGGYAQQQQLMPQMMQSMLPSMYGTHTGGFNPRTDLRHRFGYIAPLRRRARLLSLLSGKEQPPPPPSPGDVPMVDPNNPVGPVLPPLPPSPAIDPNHIPEPIDPVLPPLPTPSIDPNIRHDPVLAAQQSSKQWQNILNSAMQTVVNRNR